MGWAGGSQLADELWGEVRAFIPPDHRQTVALKFIDYFECNDCDTMDEAETLMRDADPQMELTGADGSWEQPIYPLRPRTGPAEFPPSKPDEPSGDN